MSSHLKAAMLVSLLVGPSSAWAVICQPSPKIIQDTSSANHRYKVTETLEFEEKVNDAMPCCTCAKDPTTQPSGSYNNSEKNTVTKKQSGSFGLNVQNLFEFLTFNLNDADEYTEVTESIQVIDIPKKSLHCSDKYMGFRRVDVTVKDEQRKGTWFGASWHSKTETTVSHGLRARMMYTGQSYDPCADDITGTPCTIKFAG